MEKQNELTNEVVNDQVETVVSNQKLNIYQKLLKVRKAVPYLQKASQGHQYQYVGSSQVLSALREQLDQVGLMLFPNVLDSKLTITNVENKDKYGNIKITSKLLTELTMEFVWVDVDTGESIKVPFYAQGLDTEGEKGVGKALTYAEKYFLLKQFNIATDKDDPDAFQQKTENAVPNFISEDQAKELMGYAAEIASIRNVPVDSIIQSMQMGTKNLERLYISNYQGVRNKLLNWLDIARNNNINANQQSNVQSPKTEVQQEPQQNQNLKQILQDSFVLNSYVVEQNGNAMVGKLYLGTMDRNEILMEVHQEGFIGSLGNVPYGSNLVLAFYSSDNKYYLEQIVQVLNNQTDNQTQGMQQPDMQHNNQMQQQNFEKFILNQIEYGRTPAQIPFAKLHVTRLSNNEQITVIAQSEVAVAKLQHLQNGQEFEMNLRKENGFYFFEALGGGANAS